MISLSEDTEALAERLAVAQHVSVDDMIRQALEDKAKVVGISVGLHPPRRRLSVEAMLAVGAEIAAMPLLDPRSPSKILDDLNAR